MNWFMFFFFVLFSSLFYTLSNSVRLARNSRITSFIDSRFSVVCGMLCFLVSFVCVFARLYMFVYVLLPVSECFLWVFCCCEPYSTSLSLCIFQQCYCKGLNVRDVVRLISSVELLGPQKLSKRFRNGKCVAYS